MVKLFIQGDPLYMTALSVPLIIMLIYCVIDFRQRPFEFKRLTVGDWRLKAVQSTGLFALIFGLFIQFLGLYGALEAIEVWGQVEAKMLFDGICISFIPMGYGLIIFLISRMIIYGVCKQVRLQA